LASRFCDPIDLFGCLVPKAMPQGAYNGVLCERIARYFLRWATHLAHREAARGLAPRLPPPPTPSPTQAIYAVHTTRATRASPPRTRARRRRRVHLARRPPSSVRRLNRPIKWKEHIISVSYHRIIVSSSGCPYVPPTCGTSRIMCTHASSSYHRHIIVISYHRRVYTST